MRGALSIKDWFEGLKSPGGALAKPSESKGVTVGHAIVSTATGGAVGGAVGMADSLMPGGVSAAQLGVASGVAMLASVAMASKPIGRHLSNVNVALAALAMREYAGNKTAHHAGTTSSVLTNKAKAIAAHGEVSSFGADMGAEDPLLTAGARIFGS